jgi:type IV pilus assembly protein PilM
MINWRFKNQEYRPIGLDIGHHCIKMVQLAVGDSTMKVVAARKMMIEPAVIGDEQKSRNFIVSSIRKMLETGDFRGTDVVSILPNDKLRITNLRVGQMETENVDQVLKKEAAGRFNLDHEVDSINYIYAGSVRQGDEMKNEYILFTTDDKTIRGHIEMLEEAKLRPAGIDPVSCALFRSYRRFFRRQEDKEQAELFMDVGSSFTTVVFGRGADISFVKHIGIGTAHFNQEVASRLGISEADAEMLRSRMLKRRQGLQSASTNEKTAAEEAAAGDDAAATRQIITDATGNISEKLAKEISLCFRYYTVTFRGKRTQKAIISGGGAYEATLLNVLKRHLTVEIETAQPLSGMDLTNAEFETDRRGPNSEWTVAVGLALKGYEVRSNSGRRLAANEKVS